MIRLACNRSGLSARSLRSSGRFVLTLAGLLLAAVVPATPARAVAPSDESVVDRSPLIVFGEVLGVRSGPEGTGPTTEYLFGVLEVLKGLVGDGPIVVRQSDRDRGDGAAVAMRGPSTLAKGDRVLLFLEAEDSGAHVVVEYSPQTFREVERDGRPQFFAGVVSGGENWRGAAAGPSGRPAALFRDASRFLGWIADRAAGVERAADYFWTEPVAPRPHTRLLASENPATAPASSCSGLTCLLQGGRFRVKVWYSTGGAGRPVGAALGGSAGLFTSDSGSSELLVRVVNRCGKTGYWEVYAGAASARGFNVAIRDTESNELKWFHLQDGQAVADAAAFPCASGDAGTAADGPGVDSRSRCSGVTCLLQTGAFRVRTWYSRSGGPSLAAPAVAVNLDESAGLFTSDSGHSELLVRIVNRCGATGYWTVYAGAASDASFRFAVRDTGSNELKWFEVPTGRSLADSEAFPCPGDDDEDDDDISDRAALVALYAATGGPKWIDSTNWLTDAPLDEWYGVSTDGSGNVRRIDLEGNLLFGKVPPALGNLSHLRLLDLGFNPLLEGPLPPEFFDLTELRELSLTFTGIGAPCRPRSAVLPGWSGSPGSSAALPVLFPANWAIWPAWRTLTSTPTT